MAPILQTIFDVEVAESPIHGKGLFTTRARAKGEVLTVLDGQVVPHHDDLDFLLKFEWNAVSDDLILLRSVWTSYGYINHSDQPLLGYNLPNRTLIASRDIPAGAELTLDYTEHGIPQIYRTSKYGAYL
jgi:hypothetical protein